MSLLNSASLCVTPNGYKEGTLYSVIPNTSLGDMTVVRATTATRVNSAGLIELVPYNLVTYSNTFTNGSWGTSQATLTSGQSGYDGSSNAYKLQATGTSCYIVQGSYDFTRNQSVYAKAGNYTQLSFIIGGYGTGVRFNLTTGTIADNTNTSYFTPTIESVGNGWYRCSVAISSTAPTYGFLFAPNYVAGGNSTSGDYIYIQNAQLVAGTLPKDYLRTETRLNIPRLDYSNGSCPSLLVEPQRTNLCTYSEQFDNAAWIKNNSTVTTNSIISPDGTQNADTINVTSGTYAGLYQVGNLTSNIFTMSVFAKKGTKQWLYFVNLTGVNGVAWFDLNNGTVGNVIDGTATIKDFGNGWYKCTYTNTSNILNTYLQLGFSEGNNSVTISSNGTAYLYGAQLEAGSYPTSYIPTTSAAVTRNADAIYKTGISSLIGQTEGVMFCDFVCVNNSSYCDVMAIGTDGTTGVMELQINGAASNTLRATYFYGGFVANIPALATLTIGQRYKAAFAYKSNDFVFYLNGVQQGTDTSGTVVSGMSEVSLNGYNSSSANKENALINSAILFPTRLTNAELAQLTTI